jgi:hypothetical protein
MFITRESQELKCEVNNEHTAMCNPTCPVLRSGKNIHIEQMLLSVD